MEIWREYKGITGCPEIRFCQSIKIFLRTHKQTIPAIKIVFESKCFHQSDRAGLTKNISNQKTISNQLFSDLPSIQNVFAESKCFLIKSCLTHKKNISNKRNNSQSNVVVIPSVCCLVGGQSMLILLYVLLLPLCSRYISFIFSL